MLTLYRLKHCSMHVYYGQGARHGQFDHQKIKSINTVKSEIKAAPDYRPHQIAKSIQYKPHCHSGKKVLIFVHIYQKTC